MKNRWIVGGLLALVLMTGCQETTNQFGTETREPAAVASQAMEKNDTLEVDDTKTQEETLEEDVPTLEQILGKDIDQLTDEQLKTLIELYAPIEAFEFADDGSNEDAYYVLYDAFDLKRIEIGLDVPFYSFTEVAQKYSWLINSRDIDEIYLLDEAYMDLLNTQTPDEDQLIELEEKIQALFEKNNLPGQEIVTQIQNKSVHYALYDVRGGQLSYSDDSMEGQEMMGQDEKELHENLWRHITKIIPKAYMPLLTKFEVNTDGYNNVMAHVVQEKDDYSQWRLAIDLKDAINADGTFSDEFTNTVIHEFAHVMTLHKGQLQGQVIEDETAYETDEGFLKTSSYLNQFYQRFWKEISDEHRRILETEDMLAEDAVYAFYEKYQDQFVSDYAATNPVEDIAESYRVFVIEDKPSGLSIRDQKILFMYEMDEFIQIRAQIRGRLGLVN